MRTEASSRGAPSTSRSPTSSASGASVGSRWPSTGARSIPRPETEVVVGRCLELLRGIEEPRVLDVGTGTGAIALAIADEHPGARVTAIDASREALDARPRERHPHRPQRSSCVHHDFHAGLPGGPYDLVASNPPYVEPGDLATLMPDVRDYEPRVALIGEGSVRVDRRRREGRPAPRWLARARGGRRPVRGGHPRCSPSRGTRTSSPRTDLAGRDRVVQGRRCDRGRGRGHQGGPAVDRPDGHGLRARDDAVP